MNERLNMGGGGQKRVECRAETAARAIAASDEIRAVKMFAAPSLWLNIFHSDLDLRPLLPSRMQIPSIPYTTGACPHLAQRASHMTREPSSLFAPTLHTDRSRNVPHSYPCGHRRRRQSTLPAQALGYVATGMESSPRRASSDSQPGASVQAFLLLAHRRRCRGLRGQTCELGLGGHRALPSESAAPPLGSHRDQCCHRHGLALGPL